MLIERVQTVPGESVYNRWTQPVTLITVDGRDYVDYGERYDYWSHREGESITTVTTSHGWRGDYTWLHGAN